MRRFEQSTHAAVVGVAMLLVVTLMVSAVAVEARTHGARRATVPDIVLRTTLGTTVMFRNRSQRSFAGGKR